MSSVIASTASRRLAQRGDLHTHHGRLLRTRWVLAMTFVVSFFIPSFSWAGGTISGTVTYVGIPSLPKKTPITLDNEVCGNIAVGEDLVLSKKGGIKNAVIFIQGSVPSAKPFPKEQSFSIDQKKCRFEPHVKIVPAGKDLLVTNSDGILHNFHTNGLTNPSLNKAQPKSLPQMIVKFLRPEIFSVVCDVHSWMKAWIVVAAHPYYTITDDEGKFQLTDVPAGDYTLRLWHETLGEREKRVLVSEGESTKLEFKLHQED